MRSTTTFLLCFCIKMLLIVKFEARTSSNVPIPLSFSLPRVLLRRLSKHFLNRLANTHAAGVLHNDVASRNALLSDRGAGSYALLCDFGMSRFLRGGIEEAYCVDTEMDQEKWRVQQMPPEPLRHPFPLTCASDSWMYGMFLYEVRARALCPTIS